MAFSVKLWSFVVWSPSSKLSSSIVTFALIWFCNAIISTISVINVIFFILIEQFFIVNNIFVFEFEGCWL